MSKFKNLTSYHNYGDIHSKNELLKMPTKPKNMLKYYASLNIPKTNLFAQLVVASRMSQKAVAEKINKTPSFVGDYFNGKRSMPFAKICELAEHLNIDIEVVMKNNEQKDSSENTDL